MDGKASAGVAKVLVVGNVATGKTCIIRRYTRNEFSSDYQTTIGVDFSLKSLNTDGVDINVQLWDIAGQERFAGLSRIFYTHAVGALVVYDLTDRDSFEAAAMWKKDIDAKVFFPNGDKIPVLLLGNKSDLIEDKTKQAAISDEQIEAFARQHNFFASYKVSAKTGANIREACQALVSKIVQNNKDMKKPKKEDGAGAAASAESAPAAAATPPSVVLSAAPPPPIKTGGCCN